jgi:maltose alpha-D-glucosyltransferase/alpha-amylase
MVLEPSIVQAEQSNTSVVFGDQLILKLFRRLQPGVNPDLEIGRFLTERGFEHMPRVAGAIEYLRGKEEPMTLAILQGFVPNEGDAWAYTLDVLSHCFENALSQRDKIEAVSSSSTPLLDLVDEESAPAMLEEMIGPYQEVARLLGRRTAEMHVLLASDRENVKFAPEPFSKLYQRSLYQSMRSLTRQVFQLLKRCLKAIPERFRSNAEGILEQEGAILDRFKPILEKKITAMRTRCHGDYHLGQVLYTGRDFVIIDFEGEPARPISERRIKRSPLRDVAGMLRSFNYAAYTQLFSLENSGLIRPEDVTVLESMATCWHQWVSVYFLRDYLETGRKGGFLPQTKGELQMLLDIYLLEKAVYELGYELNNRPDWVKIPLQGIQQLLKTEN